MPVPTRKVYTFGHIAVIRNHILPAYRPQSTRNCPPPQKVLLFTYLESTAGFAVRSFANSIALSTERNTQWSTSTTSTPDFFSFLLSLFYETSQLTALFGIYPGPYLLADVEDLICNTLGGAAGWQTAG